MLYKYIPEEAHLILFFCLAIRLYLFDQLSVVLHPQSINASTPQTPGPFYLRIALNSRPHSVNHISTTTPRSAQINSFEHNGQVFSLIPTNLSHPPIPNVQLSLPVPITISILFRPNHDKHPHSLAAPKQLSARIRMPTLENGAGADTSA